MHMLGSNALMPLGLSRLVILTNGPSSIILYTCVPTLFNSKLGHLKNFQFEVS